jgi:hypothetical protein
MSGDAAIWCCCGGGVGYFDDVLYREPSDETIVTSYLKYPRWSHSFCTITFGALLLVSDFARLFFSSKFLLVSHDFS